MPDPKQASLTDHLEFKDEKLAQKFASAPIPMSTLYEAYFDGAVELKTDLTTLLRQRHLFVNAGVPVLIAVNRMSEQRKRLSLLSMAVSSPT